MKVLPYSFTLSIFLLLFSCHTPNYTGSIPESATKPSPKLKMKGIASEEEQVYPEPSKQDPAFNTEDYNAIAENPFLAVLDNPLSTFSIDVDYASYSNTRRFLMNGELPPKDAVRIEEFINYFNYDYPCPQGPHPFSVTTELAECPWAEGHKLLHIGLQGQKMDLQDMPPNNLVFLLDVSGSMDRPNKLPLLKNAFKLLVNQLREEDRVSIVVYAGYSGLVLPSTPGSDKQAILDAIQNLQAGGSTAGAEGIDLAYKIAFENFQKDGNNRVILATDGDFNVGPSSDAELVRLIEEKREVGIFLSVLGFGSGNIKDNKMEQLADHGNGQYAYIDNIQEAKKVLVNEISGTLLTIAKDVKLQLEFNPAHVQAYRLIGYENRLLRNEDFNNDTKDAGELGAGHTVTALYELVPAGSKTGLTSSVDDLKYQNREISPSAKIDPDWTTVKLRYKKPNENKSTLLHVAVGENAGVTTSDNFRFSAAVAAFGMLLRDSAYKGDANYAQVINWAQGAKGKDSNGYRSSFIQLVDLAKTLSVQE